jgi:hypothetical protein
MKHAVVRVVVVALSVGAFAACGPPPVCAAVPTCAMNEVSSSMQCGANETGCRRVELCQSVIYCRPGTADAGP